jgi:hypothetical protein
VLSTLLSSGVKQSWFNSSDRTMIVEPDSMEIDRMVQELDRKTHSGWFTNTKHGYEEVMNEILKIQQCIENARLKPEFFP